MADYLDRLSIDWNAYFSIDENDEKKLYIEYNPFIIYDIIIRNEAVTAWNLILRTIEKNSSEKSLSMLAAGPVEDFIKFHGCNFIELIEEEAKKNSKFRWLLGGVWKGETNNEIWHRIEQIRGDVW